jgi:hypothetical protein
VVAERLAALGWTLERVGPEEYGAPGGGWRARKAGWVRGGYKAEHVLEQVEEHERWEAERNMASRIAPACRRHYANATAPRANGKRAP